MNITQIQVIAKTNLENLYRQDPPILSSVNQHDKGYTYFNKQQNEENKYIKG